RAIPWSTRPSRRACWFSPPWRAMLPSDVPARRIRPPRSKRHEVRPAAFQERSSRFPFRHMRRFYLITRDLHLYFGLFISPFILLFAISVFFLVHGLPRSVDPTEPEV